MRYRKVWPTAQDEKRQQDNGQGWSEKPTGPRKWSSLLHTYPSFGRAKSCVKLLGSRTMSPEDVKNLRTELDCTAKELATALGVEQETVLAWERGDLFPTKRFVTKMETLRTSGKGAIPRKPKKTAAPTSPMAVLADPATWRLVRKLVAHAELRKKVAELAENYPDPVEEAGST